MNSSSMQPDQGNKDHSARKVRAGAGKGKQMQLNTGQMAAGRIQRFVGTAIGYWRLIGSSGLLATLILLALVGMVYYEDFLNWIPETAPVAFILSVFFTYFVARTGHRTFLEEADIMFLTPLEQKIDAYFQKTFRYNLLLQAAGVFILLVILSPLYADQLLRDNQSMWPYFLLPLFLKGWNMQSAWSVLRLPNMQHVHLHTLLRFAFTFVFLLWWFSSGPLWVIALLGLALLMFFVFERNVEQKHGLKWLRLLELEQAQKGRFYRFCHSFVDVPHLQGKVRKRAWVSYVTRLLPFKQSQAFRYLYMKTFFRANDYFGIYVRLTLIGTLLVYVMGDTWARWLLYFVFLFLVGTQIQALWGHHARQFWLSIFPLSRKQAYQSFMWLLLLLLSVQAVIMSIPLWWGEAAFVWNVLLIGLGWLFAYVYSCRVVPRKLETGRGRSRM